MNYLFNGGWKFLKTELGTGLKQALARQAEFVPVDIPHDWLIYDSTRLYENGVGWYSKDFIWESREKRRVELLFEGIYMDSTIYLNGSPVGEWKYGYSTFLVDITSRLQEGENRLVVSVRYQSPNSRWYSGAGIYRNVWLRVTDARLGIEENGIYISTAPQGKDFRLRVETELWWGEEQERQEQRRQEQQETCRLVHRLYEWQKDGSLGQEVLLKQLSSKEMVCEYLVQEPASWDVEAPALYVLETTLYLEGRELQRELTRFGFREFRLDSEQGFFLNGRHLKLNGVCEHHDLGALGAAFNRAAMERKLRILKEMGVNAVRGAHNMLAPEAVELADEMGILLISEAFDMWERPKTEYDYARFFKQWSARDVESWVKRDRNHPSVILWSIGNEIYDTHADKRGLELTKYLKDLVLRYDPRNNAIPTFGSNYMPWENAQKCADILKVVGYNYGESYYKEHHEKHPDWVIYGSETAAIVQSRGVYHFPLGAPILSEDDQQCSALGNSLTSWGARSLEECVTLDRDTPYSLGQFLWSGFDYIGEPTPYHTKNSYFGQIDTAGFPKDAYYVWQAAWTDYRKKPMVHLFPYWDFNPGQIIDLRVCSNAPVVELFLNGESKGRQSLCHAPGSGRQILADYQVPYEPGTLIAVAYTEQGEELARCERKSFGNSARLVLRPEKTELCADGRDLLFVEISTVDKEGNPVENACDRVHVTVTGQGRLVGLDNGDSTDYDSYKGRSRRLFNGKLLAIIQANTEPGEIRMIVEAPGLSKTELLCNSVLKNPQIQTIRQYPKAPCGEVMRECITTLEENREMRIHTGEAKEIPVRKILLLREGDGKLTAENRETVVEAVLEPPGAGDQEVFFQVVNAAGVPSNLATLQAEGKRALLSGMGDGAFRLRCLSKSGTKEIRLISQIEFTAEGLGQAYLNPYELIQGCLYTRFRGEPGPGNERGVATARTGETVVTFDNIDFGAVGSDEITVPIFALTDEEYPIEIWEGMPGEAGSSLLKKVIYQKPSRWNVYQADTWQLDKVLTGIIGISFVLHQKVHIKGFFFSRQEKAWRTLSALSADSIYGDHFLRTGEGVEQIGNNVSLVFAGMDFGDKEAGKLTICGRAPKGSNTIHVRFFDGEKERRQIVEFAESTSWQEKSFEIEPVKGAYEVSFVFLPGSCFDFSWFRFSKI